MVIDAAIEPDYKRRILREAPDALCLGISVLTGPMIRGAIEVADSGQGAISRRCRWCSAAGIPACCRTQTLNEPLVDAVVRGQGEITLVEIAEALWRTAAHSRTSHGLSWKSDGVAQHNAERRCSRWNRLPTPAFDLVDFDAYETSVRRPQAGVRHQCWLPLCLQLLHGHGFLQAAFQCACRRNAWLRRTGRPGSALSHRRSRAARFKLSRRSAARAAISRAAFMDSGVKFRWTFQASTDFLCRMSEDEVRLLGESGVSHMGFGTESTSEDVLKLMNKRHQRVDEMFETARKANIGGHPRHLQFDLRLSGRDRSGSRHTFRTMSDIARQFRNVSFSPNIFTPYPGIPIWPQLRELGVREPQSLREWMEMPLGANVLALAAR